MATGAAGSIAEASESHERSDSEADSDFDNEDAASDFSTASASAPDWQTLLPVEFSLPAVRGISDMDEESTQDYHHPMYREVVIITEATSYGMDPWIRLLQIKPGAYNDPLQCKLMKRPLWDTGEYKALSYSWGRGPKDLMISLEVSTGSIYMFSVSTHLANAIQRLRLPDRAVCVWIDAVCIDQSNFVERAAQVGIMAQIYNQAHEVRVWLGENGTSGSKGLMDVEYFLSLCRTDSPWWTRLWILQECAYAQACPIVMIGCHLISLDKFVDSWRSVAEQRGIDFGVRQVLLVHLNLLRVPCSTWALQNTGSSLRLPIAQRIEMVTDRHCSVPHDRVYALLSLIDEKEAKQLQPDYRKPFEEVIEEVARVLVLRSGMPIDLKSLRSKLLPSWEFAFTLTSEELLRMLSEALTQEDETITQRVIRAVILETNPTHIATLFYDAVFHGAEGAISMLLASGINVTTSNWPVVYQISLSIASGKGFIKIVQLLLDAGANVNAASPSDGRTALDEALLHGQAKVVQTLLDRGADVRPQAVYHAAEKGDIDILKILIDAGMDVNAEATGTYYHHALTVACSQNNAAIVKALIGAGARVNAHSVLRGTPLMIASAAGRLAVVEALLDAGADVNATSFVNGKHCTALSLASKSRRKEVMRALRRAGAKYR